MIDHTDPHTKQDILRKIRERLNQRQDRSRPGGVVQERIARSTGTTVRVLDNRDRSHVDDDGRWYTICVDHGGGCSHDTRADAVGWSSEPEVWCPYCQENHWQD